MKRTFTFLFAALLSFVGMWAQVLADGVYTIQADENGKRGYLAASVDAEQNRPVLTEISWSNYAGNSAEAMENSKNWYLTTKNGVSYLYNVAKGAFIVDGGVDAISFGENPFGLNVTNHNNYIHVGSGTGTRFLSMGCGAKAPDQVKWEKGNANDGGCLLTFTLVENGTTTFATQIAEADEAINALFDTSVDFTQMFRVYNTKSGEEAKAWAPNADASRGALTAYDENDYKQIWQFVEGTGDKAGKYLIYNVMTRKYMQAVGGSNGVALTSNVNQAVYYTAEKHATENKYAFYHDPAATNWLYNDGGGKLAGWKNEEGDHYFTLEVVNMPVVELKKIALQEKLEEVEAAYSNLADKSAAWVVELKDAIDAAKSALENNGLTEEVIDEHIATLEQKKTNAVEYPFIESLVKTIEPDNYYIYYTDESGVKHYLQTAGTNSIVTVIEGAKAYAITAGMTSGGKFSKAYYMGMSNLRISNTNSNGTTIETKAATHNDVWTSQVVFEKDGKCAIRLTNATAVDQWHGNFFIGKGETAGTTIALDPKTSLEEAMFIWTLEKEVPVTSVTLNKTEATLTAAGATVTLVATVAPENATDKKVTWSTSDDKVATVDANGVVTAVADGKATITATVGDKTATCEVTVAIVVPVTGVTLDKETATLTAAGATVELVATVAPENATDKTVVWSTSDDKVATVDANGVVTAVADGKATITATVGDKTATCEVTVAIVVPVTGVTLDKETATLTAAGATVELVATVAPENATDKKVTWTTSDDKVATVDETGKITAVANGKATITATVGDKTATCEVTVAIVVPVTGVTLNQTEATLTAAGATVELVATVAPENATDKKVTWTTSDDKVATVDENGKVTAVANGTATITATVGDKTATCEVTVAIVVPEVPVVTLINFAAGGNCSAVSGTFGDVSFATDKGTASNAPVYNTNDQELRVYRYTNLTITSAPTVISKIVIKCSSSSYMGGNAIEVKAGESANAATAIAAENVVKDTNAKTITITVDGVNYVNLANLGSENKQLRIKSIEVTHVKAAEGVKVGAPDFSVAAGNLFASTSLALTAEEGATIYWSTDNEKFVPYTEAITIDASCTVYAYAEKDGVMSVVASSSYVMAVTCASIAELLAVETTSDGVPAIVKLEAVVDSLAKNSAFLVEGTDTLMVYDYNIPADYVKGNVVKGQLAGLWKDYKGTLELCNVDYSGATVIDAAYDLDEVIEGEWTDVTNAAPGAWAIIDHAELLGLGDYWVATNNTNYDAERGVMEFVAGENTTASLIQEYCPFGKATYRLTGKAFHSGAVKAVMFVGDQTVEIPAAAEGATFENAEEHFTTFSIEFTCESAWGTQLNVGYRCEFDNAEDFLVVGGLKLEEKKSTTLRALFEEKAMALESLGYEISQFATLHAEQQEVMNETVMPMYEAIMGGQKVLKSEVEKAIEAIDAVMAKVNPVADFYKGDFSDALFAAEELKFEFAEDSEEYAILDAAINEANNVAEVTTVADLEAKLVAFEEALAPLYNLDEAIEGDWADVTNAGAWPIIDHAELLGLGDYWVATNNTNYDAERGVMEFVAGENTTASLIQEYCPFGKATYRLTGKAFHSGAVKAVMFVGDQTVEIPAAAEGATFENAEEHFTTFSIEFTCEAAWGTQLNVGYRCEFDNAEDFLVVGGLKLEEKKSTTLRALFEEKAMALESLGYEIMQLSALSEGQQELMNDVVMPMYEAIMSNQKVLKSEVEKVIEDIDAIMAELSPVAEYYNGDFMDALSAAEELKWTLDEASQAYADLDAAIKEASDVADVTTVAELEAKVAALKAVLEAIETGVENIEAETNTVIYDLNGRRVTEMVKGGLYIVNGKKVLVK